MPRELDVYQLLRTYAQRNRLTELSYASFAQAVQRQALQADQGQPLYRDLALNPDPFLVPRLFALAKERKVVLESNREEIRTISLPERFADIFRDEYRRMDENPDVPFPDEDSLKVIVPSNWIRSLSLETDLGSAGGESERAAGEGGVAMLYRLTFPDNVKPLVVPADFVPDKLLELAVLKVRQYLRRGGNKEFLYNKLLYAFSNRDLALKDAFTSLLSKPYDSIAELRKSSSDFTYSFWAYLTSHIKKDLDKKTDKAADDWSIFQAAMLCEFYANHYKGRAQRRVDQDLAFKTLDQLLRKPPFVFMIEDVIAFKDGKGQFLLGKYDRGELEAWLKEKTTTPADGGLLPEILVLATKPGRRYYVAKDRILALTVRQVGEARQELRTRLLESWKEILRRFEQIPAMMEDAPYRMELAAMVEERFPLLDSLVRERLVPLVFDEIHAKGESLPEIEAMLYRGELQPLDELLHLPRKTMFGDARMLLPFYYSVPILSGLYRFFRRLAGLDGVPEKPSKQKGAEASRSAKLLVRGAEEERSAAQAGKPNDRKAEFAKAAAAVAKSLVPEGYSLEDYLVELEGRWNTLLNPQAKANLREDVNSLVRDYLRGILRTMRASNFTAERVKGLAANLADTPQLLKIKNHQALELYLQVYMVKLLKR